MSSPDEPSDGLVAGRGVWRAKVLSASALASALSCLLLLSANALRGNPGLVLGAQGLALFSGLATVAALTLGIRVIWQRHPSARKAVLLMSALTIAILLMHLYIIDSPPAYETGSISGTAGTTFSDGHLMVSSSAAGSQFSMYVSNVGSEANGTFQAIGGLSVSVDGVPLPSSNFRPEPSLTNPLQPVASTAVGQPTHTDGTWTVGTSQQSRIDIDYQYLVCYHVPTPDDRRGVFGCVMDESYYVPSAMGILAGVQCAPYADSCNVEHPPLGKALIAAGIATFGVDDFGWRFANVILGTLSIPLLFVLVLTLGGGSRLAYFASALFAADNLFFVHSSAALIDVPAVFFSLLGFILYFRKGGTWRVDNYLGAGILIGLASLSKETAIFSLAALISFDLARREGGLRGSVMRLAKVVAPSILIFVVGVQLYDSLLAHAALPWFYQQVNFMLTYGSGLKGGGWCLYGGSCPKGPFITPLNWLTFYTPVSYLVTAVTISGGAATQALVYVSVGYYGAANQVIVWMVYLWLPLMVYYIYRQRKTGMDAGLMKLELFLVFWFLWSYLPYVALWIYGRVTYPFYLIPAIPALASGAAYFVTRAWFPRKVALFYVLAAFAFLFLYFPVKDFLPVYVRSLLGH